MLLTYSLANGSGLGIGRLHAEQTTFDMKVVGYLLMGSQRRIVGVGGGGC